jgi:DNA-binding MarR family transcriptional regulator
LNLNRTTVIAGLPIKTVRDAIREMNRHDVNEYGWTVEKLAAHLKISETHAEWLCETLLEEDVLERTPQPDTRWHERGIYYRVSETGTRFINATMLKRIDRVRVDKLLAGLLQRVKEINGNNDLCYFINEIRLFGSAIDGKANSFADVDICYVLARRRLPLQYKQWTDWNTARAKQSGRKGLQFFSMITFGQTEVMRMLKNGSPYLSLHDLDDVVGIGADSIRLYIAPEGAIEVEGDGTSGEALSQAAMKAATERAKEKAKDKAGKKPVGPPAPVIPEEPPKERMISAVRSLAFDILRAIDESTPPEALEHSVEVAHERIKAYRSANEPERVADILLDTLSIDLIKEKKATENGTFVFSGDRERWAQDGTNDKAAAEKGMKHAVIAQLKCALTGRYDSDLMHGMTRHFETYRHAVYDEWKYRQEHGYDWYGPESLSDRAVLTIRRIVNRTGEKLDKQALKTLSDRGFIKPFRKTRWRLTAKGEAAIKYHHELDAWNKQRHKKADEIASRQA